MFAHIVARAVSVSARPESASALATLSVVVLKDSCLANTDDYPLLGTKFSHSFIRIHVILLFARQSLPQSVDEQVN